MSHDIERIAYRIFTYLVAFIVALWVLAFILAVLHAGPAHAADADQSSARLTNADLHCGSLESVIASRAEALKEPDGFKAFELEGAAARAFLVSINAATGSALEGDGVMGIRNGAVLIFAVTFAGAHPAGCGPIVATGTIAMKAMTAAREAQASW